MADAQTIEQRRRDRDALLLAFLWDAEAFRWRDRRTGLLLSLAALKLALIEYTDAVADDLAALTVLLNERRLSIAQWQVAMAHEIKLLHLAMTAAAVGGFERMTDADLSRVSTRVQNQYGYLARFGSGIEQGKVSPKQATARARMYANGSQGAAFERARYDLFVKLAGTGLAVEMKNNLRPAEHCTTDHEAGTVGCLEETRRGWVPLGTMSLPGMRRCRANCHCYTTYRVVRQPAQGTP
jgi:hypothetical protein